jgi:ribonuclease P protein component
VVRQTLKKNELLSNKKLIQELFDNGSSFFYYPFKFQYSQSSDSVNQILFAVPKRYFKKAVDRNLIRRRMREAYRKNKSILVQSQKSDTTLSIVIVYISKLILPYNEVEKKLKVGLNRLIKSGEERLNKNET